MNLPAPLLLAGLSTLPANSTLEEDVVVLTSEDLEKKRSPVFFAVHRKGNTGFSIDFLLANPAGMAAGIAPFLLCVFSRAVAIGDGSPQPGQENPLVRSELVRAERATFDLRKEEIPNSALVVCLAGAAQSGVRKIRAFLLPLAELMQTVTLATRRPLPAADHP